MGGVVRDYHSLKTKYSQLRSGLELDMLVQLLMYFGEIKGVSYQAVLRELDLSI